MNSEKREKAIDRLKKVLDSLISERPSAYDRCVDITEKLFGETGSDNKGVVLVMNGKDFLDICTIWHQHYEYDPRNLSVFADFQTPHGECDYVIVDDTVGEMRGYLCT